MVYKGIAKKLALLAVLVMTTGNAVWAAQSDSAGKEADPAFSVPVVQNPINSGTIKDLQIADDGQRWLVTDKALEQYGVYANPDKEGQYWFRLPQNATAEKVLGQDRNVSLTLPGAKSKEGRNISIGRIRRPLGISYVLDGETKSLLPPAKAKRTAAELKQSVPSAPEITKKGNLGMVLFWDPVMDEKSPIPELKTKQPVLSPCAFRLSSKGIVLRNPDLDTLITLWQEKGYAIWPLVDNNFSPKLTHEVLSQPNLRKQLIKELIGYSILYDFAGYNIDFENVNYSDRDLLTQFVREFSDVAHAYGLKVSMDVTAPSDSPNWSMVYNRQALGKSLDYVMLMAYDQVGRTSPVAGPTATLPWVETSIKNTLQSVPAEKVILGMPLYMRVWYEAANGKDLPKDLADWPAAVTETAVEAGTGTKQAAAAKAAAKKPKLFVRTLTLADSQAVRNKYKSSVVWDNALGLYKLDVQLPEGRLKIWFEDDKSLKEKVKLIPQYHLCGASFWRKGFEPANFWQGFAKHELT